MSLKSINPATGQVLATVREEGSKSVQEKIEKAQDAFQEWKKKAIPVRAKHLRAAANLLRERKQQYARLITEEMGKPIAQSHAEIDKCAWVCDYYAENAKMILKDEVIKTEASNSYVSFEPLGVVLAVMPWNFPFWQVFRFAAPALVAGNVGLLKHASNVPQCAQAIEEVWRDAALPPHAFQALFVSSGKVKRIIEHPHIVAVTLTGSEYAGSKVAETAGRHIKKTVLELGGSDPFIVLKEANLKAAAKVAVQSRMINNGQSCIAAKRIIVEECIAKSFISLLEKEIKALKVGDPLQQDTQIGPLAREEFVKDLNDLVRGSVKKGAKVILGSEPSKRKGYFYKPSLISGVKPGMPLFDKESFGPVLPVILAKDEEEAINLANHSDYGLGGAIWTENKELAQRLVKQLQVGSVAVNGMVASDPRIPFGGIKRSGYGRELSHFGIKEFVNIKSVVFHN